MRKKHTSEAGFTLVELFVVIAILGLLATISVFNYIRMTDRAQIAACHGNQRTIFQHANLYAIDRSLMDASLNVGDMVTSGDLPGGAADCPTSATEDFSDYVVTVEDGAVVAIRCEIEPDEHLLEFPFGGGAGSGPPM